MRIAQTRGIDLAGAVLARAQLLDAPGVDIEADHRAFGAREGHRDRQPHVAESDDGDPAVRRHVLSPGSRTLSAPACANDRRFTNHVAGSFPSPT